MPSKNRNKNKITLGKCLHRGIKRYFKDMKGADPQNIHEKIVTEVEKHLIEYVINYTNGNRSRAANILGLSRSTLRKKIGQHQISIEPSSD